jgi:hypothetical protein
MLTEAHLSIRTPDVTPSMSSIKRDVKKKVPPRLESRFFLDSQPTEHWLRCNCNEFCFSILISFSAYWWQCHRVESARQANGVECVNHGSIRGSWPMAISGYPRRYNVKWVTRCECTQGQISLTDTLLEPSICRTRATTSEEKLVRWGLFLSNAQAACRCNCLGSKLTPFFHMVRVMAAIFLARVSRAMVGRIPLSTRAT